MQKGAVGRHTAVLGESLPVTAAYTLCGPRSHLQSHLPRMGAHAPRVPLGLCLGLHSWVRWPAMGTLPGCGWVS